MATTDGVGVPRPPVGVADDPTTAVPEEADLAGMDGAARTTSTSPPPVEPDPSASTWWDDPLAGFDMTTPAWEGESADWEGEFADWEGESADREGESADWEREVVKATASLKFAGTKAEVAFGRWASGVFEFDPATLDVRPPHVVFTESVFSTYGEEFGKKGITKPTGLSGWLARQLAEELALGRSSEFWKLLPYSDPENMSEQQRDALNRIWLDKMANVRTTSYEVTRVALHLLAKGLDQPMRLYHPFGDPYEDIGPPPADGAIPRPVVWWKGGYIVLRPLDSADTLARLASGYQRTSIPEREQQRWDSLYTGALGLLKARIDTAEKDSSEHHRSLLRYTLDRDLAAIGKRPFSPRRLAEELDAYRGYLTGLSDDGIWAGDYRWELEDPFTLRFAATVKAAGGAKTTLRTNLGRQEVALTGVDHVVLTSDMVAVDFGSVDGAGVGIVKIPYLANGVEKFAYREIDRKFSDTELAELRGRVPGQVWQLDDQPVGSLYHITSGFDPATNQLTRSFGKGSEGEKTRRARIPVAKVVDGRFFTIPNDMKEVILRLGYGPDHRPIAVVVMPAEKSGAGRDLYLQLVSPAPTVDDVELLRKTALWERSLPWWSISSVKSFNDTIGSRSRLPVPLGFSLGGKNWSKTPDGREVNLAPGTPVTLQVGERRRPVGKDHIVDSVNEVVVVVKVPLLPIPDAPASEPEYAFKLFSMDEEVNFADLIEQLQERQTLLDRRRERAESGGRRAPKRPRVQDGSSVPGPASASHQPPPPPDVAGEAGRGDRLLPSQLSEDEVSARFRWLGG
ncbi:hypothetical protein, partial [Micromonospora fulviviridis]|uniref:hypothetical protein n=1 Tax=Micromonospora fulviviridis TaxID=47860 RepID=UPI00379F58FE